MKLKIGLIQMNVEMGNREKNVARVQTLLEKAMKEDPDVLVLPETWDLGFFPSNALELADEKGQESISFLSSFSKEHHVNIVGGTVCVKEEGKLYNRSFTFDREGNLISTYDKAHLFSLSGEDKAFTKGREGLQSFTLDGIPSSEIICYDLRFPEYARKAALQGASLLFIPAAWPAKRKYHWETLCKARAIENQIFVIAVNQRGISGDTHYGGDSMIIDPWGEELCHMKEADEIAFVTIDMDVLKETRETIQVYKDRRPDLY